MTEQFANNAVTTLAAPMLAGSLTATVESAANFPATGNFWIKIDTELRHVTGVSVNTFTVDSLVGAVGHDEGARVSMVVTAAGLAQLRDDAVALAATATGVAIAAIPDATQLIHGHLSTTDKTKLDGIAEGATNNTLVIGTTTGTAGDGGVLAAKVSFPGFGTSGSTACVGNDARLSDATTAAHGLQTALGKRIELQHYQDCHHVVLNPSTWNPASFTYAELDGATSAASVFVASPAFAARILCSSGTYAGIWVATSTTAASADPDFVVVEGASVKCIRSAGAPEFRQTGTTTAVFKLCDPGRVVFHALGGGADDWPRLNALMLQMYTAGDTREIYMPDPLYICNTPGQLQSRIRIRGTPHTVIQSTMPYNNGHENAVFTNSRYFPINTTSVGASTIGDTTIVATSVAGMVVGDMMIVADTGGECIFMTRITKITSTTITTDVPLPFAYQNGSTIYVGPGLSDWEIDGGGMRIEGTADRLIWVPWSERGVVKNLTLKCTGKIGSAMAYAGSFDFAGRYNRWENVTADCVTFTDCPNGLTMEGQVGSEFRNCTAVNFSNNAFEFGSSSRCRATGKLLALLPPHSAGYKISGVGVAFMRSVGTTCSTDNTVEAIETSGVGVGVTFNTYADRNIVDSIIVSGAVSGVQFSAGIDGNQVKFAHVIRANVGAYWTTGSNNRVDRLLMRSPNAGSAYAAYFNGGENNRLGSLPSPEATMGIIISAGNTTHYLGDIQIDASKVTYGIYCTVAPTIEIDRFVLKGAATTNVNGIRTLTTAGTKLHIRDFVVNVTGMASWGILTSVATNVRIDSSVTYNASGSGGYYSINVGSGVASTFIIDRAIDTSTLFADFSTAATLLLGAGSSIAGTILIGAGLKTTVDTTTV